MKQHTFQSDSWRLLFRTLSRGLFFSLLFFCTFSHPLSAGGYMDFWGTPKWCDTLAMYPVGPGTEYLHIRFPNDPLEVHLMTIDLSDPHNKIETFLAKDSIKEIELLTTACNRFTTPGHNAYAAINAAFYEVASIDPEFMGAPRSGNIGKNILKREPGGWMASIGFDINDTPFMDYMEMHGQVTCTGKVVNSYGYSQVNRRRGDNELSFYNQYTGKLTRTNDNGTEVFIRPVSGEWMINQPILCKVEKVIKNKGKNIIAAGESVLSGSGAAQLFLDQFQVGDEITVHHKITMPTYHSHPTIQFHEMVSGNAVVLADGVLTDRNHTESYNSTSYPRSGLGYSSDQKKLYMMVVDGRQPGFSIGLDTKTMCAIFKAAGASYVINLDGGGSAEMALNRKIVNRPSDGQERAVGDGLMMICTAPEDQNIASIHFTQPSIRVYRTSSCQLHLIGNNPYSIIVNENLKGLTFECPTDVGSVDPDGFFTAGMQPAKGYITARQGDLSTQIKVEVVDAPNLNIYPKYNLIDTFTPAVLTANTKDGVIVYPLNPLGTTYQVEDPTICKVEEGKVYGLKEGSTKVIGTFSGHQDTIDVEVQIGKDFVVIDDFSTPIDYTVSKSVNIKTKPLLSTVSLPQGWNKGVSVTAHVTYTKVQDVQIGLNQQMLFYGLPDSISLKIQNGNLPIKEIFFFLNLPSGQAYSKNAFSIPAQKDTLIHLSLSTFEGTPLFSYEYPLTLTSLRFYADNKTMTVGESYVFDFAIQDLTLYYPLKTLSSIQEEPMKGSLGSIALVPNPAQNAVTVIFPSDGDKSRISIHTLDGRQLFQTQEITSSGAENRVRIDLSSFSSGIYILQVEGDQKNFSQKLIVSP